MLKRDGKYKKYIQKKPFKCCRWGTQSQNDSTLSTGREGPGPWDDNQYGTSEEYYINTRKRRFEEVYSETKNRDTTSHAWSVWLKSNICITNNLDFKTSSWTNSLHK
jgi:hypothetical protein